MHPNTHLLLDRSRFVPDRSDDERGGRVWTGFVSPIHFPTLARLQLHRLVDWLRNPFAIARIIVALWGSAD